MLYIPGILDADHVAMFRARLSTAAWADGRITGRVSVRSRQEQFAAAGGGRRCPRFERPGARGAQPQPAVLLGARCRATFLRRFSIAIGAARASATTSTMPCATTAACSAPVKRRLPPLRTDLSATLFLSAPEEYEGGELVIDDPLGARRVKLPAGDLVAVSGDLRASRRTDFTGRTAGFLLLDPEPGARFGEAQNTLRSRRRNSGARNRSRGSSCPDRPRRRLSQPPTAMDRHLRPRPVR